MEFTYLLTHSFEEMHVAVMKSNSTYKYPIYAHIDMLGIYKGKGIRFIVLYPPKCSHDLPPLAGTVHTETISIPQGIFQSNWQHIAHTL